MLFYNTLRHSQILVTRTVLEVLFTFCSIYTESDWTEIIAKVLNASRWKLGLEKRIISQE